MKKSQIRFIDNMLTQIMSNQLAMLKAMCKSEDDEVYPNILETGIILKVLDDERLKRK